MRFEREMDRTYVDADWQPGTVPVVCFFYLSEKCRLRKLAETGVASKRQAATLHLTPQKVMVLGLSLGSDNKVTFESGRLWDKVPTAAELIAHRESDLRKQRLFVAGSAVLAAAFAVWLAYPFHNIVMNVCTGGAVGCAVTAVLALTVLLYKAPRQQDSRNEDRP